ncbi:MAG: type II secretion system F family protein [Spirochaetota bacterium]
MGDRSVIRLSRADEARLVEGVSSLVDGGIPIVDAYRVLASDTGGQVPRVRAAAAAVAEGLEWGAGLRDCLTSSVARVDPVHEAMLGVIDATGEARVSLGRARRFLIARREIRDRTIGALLYPALVTVLALAGSVALLVFVLPAAQRLIAPLAGPDAGVAALVVRGRRSVAAFSAALALAAGVPAVLAGSRGSSHPTPRLDRLRSRLPFYGRYELTADLFACTSALAGSTRVGIQLVDALGIAARCSASAVVAGRMLEAAVSIAHGAQPGEELARAMAGVPGAAYRFRLCGSGSDVAETAETVAEQLAVRLERSARRLGSVLEPALVAAVGAALVAIVATLVAPLFRLYAEVLP